MTKIYSLEELILMSDTELRCFLNNNVAFNTKTNFNGSGVIVDFEVAPNAPHHICGFILDNGRHISFDSIKSITIQVSQVDFS